MTLLYSASDFSWHKKALDVGHKANCRHSGEPDKFPCQVVSEFWDDPNGPYTYNHTFVYQQQVQCAHCGNVANVWPEQAA